MANSLLTTIVLGGKISPSLNAAFSNAQKGAKQTQTAMSSITKGIATGMKIAGGAAIVGMGLAVKSAMDYQTSLAKVGTIADTQKKSMSELSKEVIALSNKTGVAGTEINAALYEAISAGADTAKATSLVEVAVKSAKGGFTDAATAMDGLTSVMNTYGIATGDAESLANQFIITQNLGKTTFGDLAGSIGKLAPITKAAGLGTNQMLSALAATTAQGIQTSESVSGIKAAISNVIKPTDDAMKTAKALGLEFSTTALESKGLAGFLMDVRKKTGGNLDTMAQLFGSVEGLNTVLALTSDGGMNVFNQSMGQMQTNSSALQDAYAKMANTTGERMARLGEKVRNAGITVGEKLLPYIESAVDWLSKIDFEKFFNSQPVQFVVESVGKLLTAAQNVYKYISANWVVIEPILWGIVGAIGAFAIATGIIKAYTLITGIMAAATMVQQGATWAAAAAQWGLNSAILANPMTWIILAIIVAIGLVVAAIYFLWKNWDAVVAFLGKAWNGFVNGLKVAWDAIWNGIIFAFKSYVNIWIAGINFIIGALNKIQFDVPDWVPALGGKHLGINIPLIPYLAAGATVSAPTLAMIGEAGTESVVPHNNKPRSRALLAEAAAGVGMKLGGGNTYVYSPVINGGGNNVGSQLKDGYDDFVAYIERYSRNKERESYA